MVSLVSRCQALLWIGAAPAAPFAEAGGRRLRRAEGIRRKSGPERERRKTSSPRGARIKRAPPGLCETSAMAPGSPQKKRRAYRTATTPIGLASFHWATTAGLRRVFGAGPDRADESGFGGAADVGVGCGGGPTRGPGAGVLRLVGFGAHGAHGASAPLSGGGGRPEGWRLTGKGNQPQASLGRSRGNWLTSAAQRNDAPNTLVHTASKRTDKTRRKLAMRVGGDCQAPLDGYACTRHVEQRAGCHVHTRPLPRCVQARAGWARWAGWPGCHPRAQALCG